MSQPDVVAPRTERATPSRHERVAGSVFGLAYGDAMGAPTEFMGIEAIVARHGGRGPRELPEDGVGVARVTDDTQMALAVARSLLTVLRSGDSPSAATWERPLRTSFAAWARSPDNNRAPGTTCLRACEALERGGPWQDATIIGSKGCGANMRVAPVAYVPGLDLVDMAGAAQFQAALTHGHPTALAASELTACAIRFVVEGTHRLSELPGALAQRAREQRAVYREDWLGDLWRRSHDPSPEAFITRGWDECLRALGRLDAALAAPDPDADPCVATGAGWVAEEALSSALHAALLFPDEPVGVLGRAAATSGDSDSIACLAGAVVGGLHGIARWPAAWAARIEYADELAVYARAWG